MSILNRRGFISAALLSAGSMAFSACSNDKKRSRTISNKPLNQEVHKVAIDRNVNKDAVFNLLEQRVNSYMAVSNNCAQSSFLALNDQFSLEGESIVKALTPLPGVAERGETCGAVTGCLMAMGLIYGNDNIADQQTYRDSLIPAGKFCGLFKEKYGSTMCSDIHKVKFGRSFKLNDPAQLLEFQASGGTRVCSTVVSEAVKMAAGVILDIP